jgi:hypothetical protein
MKLPLNTTTTICEHASRGRAGKKGRLNRISPLDRVEYSTGLRWRLCTTATATTIISKNCCYSHTIILFSLSLSSNEYMYSFHVLYRTILSYPTCTPYSPPSISLQYPFPQSNPARPTATLKLRAQGKLCEVAKSLQVQEQPAAVAIAKVASSSSGCARGGLVAVCMSSTQACMQLTRVAKLAVRSILLLLLLLLLQASERQQGTEYTFLATAVFSCAEAAQ